MYFKFVMFRFCVLFVVFFFIARPHKIHIDSFIFSKSHSDEIVADSIHISCVCAFCRAVFLSLLFFSCKWSFPSSSSSSARTLEIFGRISNAIFTAVLFSFFFFYSFQWMCLADFWRFSNLLASFTRTKMRNILPTFSITLLFSFTQQERKRERNKEIETEKTEVKISCLTVLDPHTQNTHRRHMNRKKTWNSQQAIKSYGLAFHMTSKWTM